MEEELVLTTDASSEGQVLPEALQVPTRNVRLGFLLALPLANAVLTVCYSGISGLLLPLQLSTIDPANKVVDLGIATSISAFVALVSNPLIGAFSDRTTSRFGRRRPWIFAGALLTTAALAMMMSAQAVIMLIIGMAALQLFSSFVLAPLTAIIPDKIPPKQLGSASGAIGMATIVGAVVASVVIGLLLKVPTPSYLLMIVLVLVIHLPFALFFREKALPREYVQAFHLGDFLKNFWVNPRKHPDFAWAWLTRFIPLFGYYLGMGYLFYYLQDAVHYQKLFPGQAVSQGVAVLTLVGTAGALVCTLLGGILSDRFQRRKPFVALANVLIAIVLVILGFVPSWTMLLITSVVLGMGLGIYQSVDAALITQVLPSANNRAKDMGIVNIANALPQVFAPAVAAFIITVTHSYLVLFTTGAVVTLLGPLVVSRIKSVR